MIVEIIVLNVYYRSNCKRDFQSESDLNYFQSSDTKDLELSHVIFDIPYSTVNFETTF